MFIVSFVERANYRLPSEAEWEYACRAGSTSAFFWGADESRRKEFAWSGDNSGGHPHAVGQLAPNAWGLHDILGNVYEYCADAWSANIPVALGQPGATQFTDPFVPSGGPETQIVVRSTSWDTNPLHCRCAFRGSAGKTHRNQRDGFRVVREVDGSSPAPRPAAEALASYRAELAALRSEFGGGRDLPDVRFFLFGLGQRAKLLYRDGRLLQAHTGAVVREWKRRTELIVPPDYRVELELADGTRASLREDEEAVWIEEAGTRTALDGTRAPVKLPDFAAHRYPQVLRVLHQELLVNVTPTGPVPNLFVYSKPWYRDGAMMALAFRETENLHTLQDWIGGLGEPFDRNNAGETEADNLGQALFLVSLAGDKSHPLVAKVLAEAPRFEAVGTDGKFIKGRSDFAEHPVYQTKWMKLGLRSLGLPDPYVVPQVEDGYSALFWMDYRDRHVVGGDSDNRADYPYLGWACDHFHGAKKSPLSLRDYPLTWEARASQARYEGMRIVDPVFVDEKLAVPHAWHAAEAFLYLLSLPAEPAK